MRGGPHHEPAASPRPAERGADPGAREAGGERADASRSVAAARGEPGHEPAGRLAGSRPGPDRSHRAGPPRVRDPGPGRYARRSAGGITTMSPRDEAHAYARLLFADLDPHQDEAL